MPQGGSGSSDFSDDFSVEAWTDWVVDGAGVVGGVGVVGWITMECLTAALSTIKVPKLPLSTLLVTWSFSVVILIAPLPV